MKFIKTMLLIALPLFCNGQTPDFCELLNQTLNNAVFTELFKVDTSYTGTILIVDKYSYLKQCHGIKIYGRNNSFIIDTIMPEAKPLFYNCRGIVKDNDDSEQYFIDISNCANMINLGVYFKFRNGKWEIDHFDSA